MGALVMFGLVSAIAIVGVLYFNHQYKKKTNKISSKNNERGCVVIFDTPSFRWLYHLILYITV